MWLLPSLARPANLARFFAACKETGTTTPGMVLIDAKDNFEHIDAYGELSKIERPPGWHFRITQGRTQGDKIREVWDEVKDCAWLGLIGDDCIPETPGWDRLMVAQLAQAGIVSCNDGWNAPNRLANCWIMSGPVVRAVGYIFPPSMHHLFVDDVWEQLGSAGVTGAWQTLMAVMVRHAHVMKGEGAIDATHRAAYGDGFTQEHPGPDRNAGLWTTDEAVYKAWLVHDRQPAIAAIIGLDPPVPAVAQLQRVKSRSVLICTPMKDHPTRQFLHSAWETKGVLMELGVKHGMQEVVGTSNLPRARNELAACFLASGCDDCIMIDADMGWSAADITRLISSPHQLIGAAGTRKVDLPDDDILKWCFRPLPVSEDRPGEYVLEWDAMGNLRVETLGTGFLKISREVFEKLIAAHPDWKRDGRKELPQQVLDNYYRFFQFPDDNDETGEDYDFCNRWAAIGGEVWLDPTISLIHAGDKEYAGNIGALFQTRKAEPESVLKEAA